MAQIVAWQCEQTKTVFTDENEYRKHVRSLAAYNREKKKKEKIAQKCSEVFAHMRSTVRTADQLREFITNNFEYFAFNAKANGYYGKRMRSGSINVLAVGLVYQQDVNITFLGKRTDVLPRFRLTLHYLVDGEKHGTYNYGCNMWDDTGIHGGYGGVGSSYYFEGSLFAEDWPAMNESQQCVNDTMKLHGHVVNLAEFDTKEKVDAFKLKYSQDAIDRATVWKTLSNDNRLIGTIINDVQFD